MRIRRILCLLLAGLGAIQIILLYSESRFMQGITSNQKRPTVHRVLGGHTLDSTGRYRIHRYYKSEGFGLDSIQPRDVTLVTHCTVDRIDYVFGLAEAWAGPMSISIFAPGSDAAYAEDVIDGLRLCWPALRKWTSFHLVYPKERRMRANMTGVGGFAYYSCKDITRKMMLRKLSDNGLHPKHGTAGEDDPLHYPHNLMRNVALSGAMTEFVLSIDVEMIPSTNLRRYFLEFAKSEGLFWGKRSSEDQTAENVVENVVFVLPAFELTQDKDAAISKPDLLQALDKMDARPLLQETCGQCHKSTNYDKWISMSEEDQKFRVAYHAHFAPGWEPYFISRRDAPWYDENMLKYGQDRLSLICDLRARKYSFPALNNGFLMKLSFKYKSEMTRSELLRINERAKFHERFRNRLRESGKIQDEHITAC